MSQRGVARGLTRTLFGHGESQFMRDIGRHYIALFPELKSFTTDAARKGAMRKASEGIYVSGSLLGGLALFIGLRCAKTVQELTGLAGLLLLLLFGAICGLSGFVFVFVGRRRIRRSLRAQLNTHGVPTCMCCGYDLRGLDDTRCPECGVAFVLPDSGHALGQERTQSEECGGRTP